MGHTQGLYLKVAFLDLLTALYYRDVSDAEKKRLKEGSKSLLLNCPAPGSHEGCGFLWKWDMCGWQNMDPGALVSNTDLNFRLGEPNLRCFRHVASPYEGENGFSNTQALLLLPARSVTSDNPAGRSRLRL